MLNRIGVVLLAIGVASCGDSTSPSEKRWVGDWVAVSVGGQTLPATVTVGGTQERVVSRTLSISSGDWASYKDSSLMILPTALNLSATGIMQWHEESTTSLFVTRRNPCLCVGGVFIDRTFTLRSDGMLEGEPSFAGEGKTVFRRQ